MTVLDHDPDQVETLRNFGLKSFYGDASRLDLLHAAGAAQAKLFILAIDDEVKSLAIIETVQRHFPRVQILARATSRQHAYELLRLGVPQVYRETFGSALDLSVDALHALGMDEPRARRVAEFSAPTMKRLCATWLACNPTRRNTSHAPASTSGISSESCRLTSKRSRWANRRMSKGATDRLGYAPEPGGIFSRHPSRYGQELFFPRNDGGEFPDVGRFCG